MTFRKNGLMRKLGYVYPAGLGVFLFLAAGCLKPSPEERFAEIKKLFEDQKTEEALEATVLLAEDVSRIYSLQADEGSHDRMLRRSLDGSAAAWIHSGRVHYRRNSVTESVPLSITPEGLSVSFDGSILSVWRARAEGDCRFEIIRLPGKDSPEAQTALYKFPSCSPEPRFTASGYVYFIKEQGLHRAQLSFTPGVQEIQESEQIVAAAAVRPPVPKIGHSYNIYDGGNGLILLFSGSLGVYKLYTFYESSGRLGSVNRNFSSPQLIYSSENAVMKDHPDPEKKDDNPAYPNQPVKPSKGKKGEIFLFEGGAGRYSLRKVRLENGSLSLLHSFRVTPMRNIIHSGPENQFLTLTEDRISVWNGSDNTVKELPLRSGNFTLFDEGILYEGIDQNLYLRNTLFTDLEYEIMNFEEKLRSHLREKAEKTSEETNGK